MKKEEENIDLLLEQNANEQLADFDWEKLNSAILKRVNKADLIRRTTKVGYRSLFKIAAGIAVVTVVLIVAVMVKTEKPMTMGLGDDARTVVNLTESKGTASVEILDSNERNGQGTNKASWIIIRTNEQKVADNGHSKDEMDFACLM